MIPGLMVVKDHVRSLAFQQKQARFASSCGDHFQSRPLGELQRGQPDAPRRAVDEDGLAASGRGAVKQGVVCRGIGDAQTGALFERHLGWQRMNLGGQAQAEFCKSACDASGKVDPLATPISSDLGSHRLHQSGAVHARGVGEGREAEIVAGADISVDRVDSGRVDAHQHLIWRRFKVWQMLEL